MVLTMKFTLQRYRTWNHEIFQAIRQFIETHRRPPHISSSPPELVLDGIVEVGQGGVDGKDVICAFLLWFFSEKPCSSLSYLLSFF